MAKRNQGNQLLLIKYFKIVKQILIMLIPLWDYIYILLKI